MYLFIAIIFTAELIIALTIISWIIKADKKIETYNKKLMKIRPCFEKIIKEVNFCINSFGEYYDCVINSLKKRQRQFHINLIKNIIMYLALFTLKGRYKKAAAFLQFAILFRDYLIKVREN